MTIGPAGVRAVILLGALAALAGCSKDTGSTGTDSGAAGGGTDADGDGWTVEEGDCEDDNDAVNPGAAEVCDAIDNDCDYGTDEGEGDQAPSGAVDWYADADGDGYGDAALPVSACAAPKGHVADATDCDDTAANANPGITTETCNDGVDNDCDGSRGSCALGWGVAGGDADGDGTDDVLLGAPGNGGAAWVLQGLDL